MNRTEKRGWSFAEVSVLLVVAVSISFEAVPLIHCPISQSSESQTSDSAIVHQHVHYGPVCIGRCDAVGSTAVSVFPTQ